MSLGNANYLLQALLTKGFVKVQNFRNNSNNRGYAYLLTPEGIAAKADLTLHFLARKMEEYDALRLEIERLRAESESAAEGKRGRAKLAGIRRCLTRGSSRSVADRALGFP
jgi:EPS-associated MarR family transcriptional regulator